MSNNSNTGVRITHLRQRCIYLSRKPSANLSLNKNRKDNSKYMWSEAFATKNFLDIIHNYLSCLRLRKDLAKLSRLLIFKDNISIPFG